MKFIADLHIHSKYSRATAGNLDLEHLYVEARKKGIQVVGTGDSTHPAWFAELKDKLVPDEEGLFRLRPDLEAACDRLVPPSCAGPVRFMLESEISSIYKKNGKTRKNHNLVYFPDFDSAGRFNAKLDVIGNIRSDGRPILGLDARNLLEILLENDQRSFLIPAHIWTPWFSLLGSRSGFDSLSECFEDLTGEIFAVETGLSSDPSMNWRVSFLDHLTLVSNSDAHSPAKLGREANLFDTDMSYPAIVSALKSGGPDRFLGTLEFFPEEGKYHHDGHRQCQVRLSPEESVRRRGICPSCGKPLTLGVNYRILELADRKEGERPAVTHPYHSIIPLNEVMAEILGCGVQTKKVGQALARAVEILGPELVILRDLSVSDIRQAGIPLLAEAIERIRSTRLNIQPGYDGEYGRIRIFTDDEREELMGQTMMFSFLGSEDPGGFFPAGSRKHQGHVPKAESGKAEAEKDPESLNDHQRRVVTHPGGPLLVVAGPGTGKTHTLIRKIGRLIEHQNVDPRQVLAITFTVRAAREMEERLSARIEGPLPLATTFHALGHALLSEWHRDEPVVSIVDETDRMTLIREVLDRRPGTGIGAARLLSVIERAKQAVLGPDDVSDDEAGADPDAVRELFRDYQDRLSRDLLRDYDDLLCDTVRRLESDADLREQCRRRFTHVFVDEYQDLNHAQYRLVRALCPPDGHITVIGDPDQAIYGFRGSDAGYFLRFQDDFPGAETVRLTRNYRSTETILEGAFEMISRGGDHGALPRTPVHSGREGVRTITVLENPSEKAEGTAIGKCIEQLMGGTGFHSMDFQTDILPGDLNLGFSDFAVLTRTGAQGRIIAEALGRGGIPCRHVSRDDLLTRPSVIGLLAGLKHLGGRACSDQEIRTLSRLVPEGFSSVDPLIAAGLADPAVPVRERLEILGRLPGLSAAVSGDDRDAFDHLLAMSDHFGNDLGDYLDTLRLAQDGDLVDLRAEKVSIMTMHASKGLEFKVVFIAGCEEGLIPFRKSGMAGDPDEERRLFYVAMTRARDLLFLSFARKRSRFGRIETTTRSPFLTDIDRKRLRYEVPVFARMEQAPKPVQLSLF
ncbi:UvrD-helicase domain-containing protein [Desulfatiferula olefinivorans]